MKITFGRLLFAVAAMFCSILAADEQAIYTNWSFDAEEAEGRQEETALRKFNDYSHSTTFRIARS